MPDDNFAIVYKARFDWSNTPGRVPAEVPIDGAMAIQQADGLLFLRTPAGTIKAYRLITPAEYAALQAGSGGGGGPASTDGLPEGTTNRYYTDARARAAFSVTGGLTYNQATGVFRYVLPAPTTTVLGGVKAGTAASGSFVTGIDATGALTFGTPTGGGSGPANTDALPEGTSNLYFTQSRSRNVISATGSIAYDAATGVISYNAPALAAVATSGSASDLTTGTMPTGRLPAFTGDVTSSAGASALTLAASGVTAGAYVLPTITLDAKGRATAASQGALTGDVTTTAGSLVTAIANGVVTYAKLATAALAGAADLFANVASKLVSVASLWASQVFVPLTDAATIAVDMSTGINFKVTLAGNRTLGAPTNAKEGQSGVIQVTQDGTGSRTLAFATAWDFGAAGTPTLSTGAGKTDTISYVVINTTGPVVRAFFGKSA